MGAQTIKSSIKASFNSGVVSGAAEGDITSKTMSALKLTASDMTSRIFWTGGSGGSNESTWEGNVDASPTLLNDAISLINTDIVPSFDPIYTLASGSTQKALQNALKAYLPPQQAQGLVFQSPTVEPPSTGPTTKLATSNGFAVMCITQEDRAWSVATITAAPTQGLNSPSLGTAIGCSRLDDRKVIDTWIQRASAILPVRQETYYTKTFAGVTPASAFIPTSLQFGAYQQLPSLPQTVQSDGLLIVSWLPQELAVGRIEIAYGPVTVGLVSMANSRMVCGRPLTCGRRACVSRCRKARLLRAPTSLSGAA